MKNAKTGLGLAARSALTAMLLAFALSFGLAFDDVRAQTQPDPVLRAAPQQGAVPGGTLGVASDAQLWRAIRKGVAGSVSIPDKKAAQLVQSEGDNWRAIRNGPLMLYGSYALGGMVLLLALFYLLRGRIRVDHGLAGETITRFNTVERAGHWLLAVSFLFLAVTGLCLLYGRQVFIPVIGKEAFAIIAVAGKYLHNYVAFAFMVGVTVIFFLWVLHNLPSRHDIMWILKGGGLFVKGVHPSARKFNPGQKMIFWLVVLGGISLSVSGWALLFPFTTSAFAHTFDVVNGIFGTTLPTNLTVVQEQQYSQLWHAIVGIFLICVVIAHIYIGTIGMEGAFDAMGSGEVDLNWAKEHHDLWVEDVQAKAAERPVGGTPQPAE